METLLTITSWVILFIGIGFPIVLLVFLKSKTKYYAIFYFLIGLLVLDGIIWGASWWSDKSDHILLEYYGYNIDGMNEREFYQNVLPENLERVKSIEISIMGLGWPVKAIFAIIILSPYLLVVYFGYWLFEGLKNMKKRQLTSILP
jgi:hypothetical protein